MNILNRNLLSALMLGTCVTMSASPVSAQARSVAVVDVEAAIRGSQAWQNALTSIRTTYASQIQAAQTRSQALEAEIKPLVDAYNAAAQQPNATPESVRPYAQPLQQKQQAAQAELQRLNQPISLARAYVQEQIAAQLDASVKAAMAAKQVDLALPPQAVIVISNPEVNLTDEVVTEINRRVQSVQVQPPAGWQPGQTQQQAQQPAAQ